ncbi:MAG: hypothetical protein J3R72DRAFT_528067 [Linnemannia gamsii]|nr:MAG: hypothetical protein J3R72DRAFT_528067 [Linnemannia gamsii]
MGKLIPDCLTSTPDGSTFYGVESTESTDETVSDSKYDSSFVIVKSNTHPTSPENLTWSVWNRIYLDDLPPKSMSGGKLACAVNNEGVFTFIGRFGSSTFYPSEPYGYRYDPNGKSGSGSIAAYNGRGTWTVVKIQYEWRVFYDIHLLEYVNSPTGLQLVHCHRIDYKLNCATYNEETNALVTGWSWIMDMDASPVGFAVGHDRLYIVSRKGLLYSYPLFPVSNSLPTGITLGAPSNCTYTVPQIIINQKAMYLICTGEAKYSTPASNLLYVNRDPIGGITTLDGPETLTPVFTTIRTTRAIGSGTGDGHFILGVSYPRLTALSLDGSPRTTYNLTQITVSDTSGDGNGDPSMFSKYIEGTVGGICTFVILAVLGVFYYKRRSSNAKATQDISQAEAGPDTPANVESKPPIAPAGPSNQLATSPPIGSSFTPAAQSTPLQSTPSQSPTPILPMTPIPPASQQQMVQNQMQELGFSNHPRPTVAATSTGVPWQPTPFVPPSSSQRIRVPELDGSTTPNTGDNSTTSPPPPIPRSSKPYSEAGSQPIPPTAHHPHTN